MLAVGRESWSANIFFLILVGGLISLVLAESPSSSFEGWTCDELTPNLCNLNVETSTILVKGISVRFWRYSSPSLNSSSPIEKFPLVVLHGGPGWPHGYLLPLKQLACTGRDVIFYDQAGCGESRLPDNESVAEYYPWLLDPAYYAQEVDALVQHLIPEGQFHILGHSWGTILAQIFALNGTKLPSRQRMASMTLSGCISDTDLYIQEQWDPTRGSLGSLPIFVQERIHSLEADQSYDSPEYEALDQVLTTFFTCRTAPLPDCFVESSRGVNPEIYVGMQGASEFTISGVLAHFNVTERLSMVEVPVLLTTGEFDTVRPRVAQACSKSCPCRSAGCLKTRDTSRRLTRLEK